VTSIRGYAETLTRGVADPATRDEFIQVIHRNGAGLPRKVAQQVGLFFV